jgi:carotenoid cleavage dioxygenase-like enzyme
MRILKGTVPPNLKGTYFKVGPTWDPSPGNAQRHILDGHGFLVKVAFPGNGTTPKYQGRFIQTKCRKEARYGNAFGGPLLTPSGGIRNPSNTNVVYWNNTLTTWYDGGAPVSIDPTTLETLLHKPFLNFKDGLPFTSRIDSADIFLKQNGVIGNALNAHPKIDAENKLISMELSYSIFPSMTHVTFHTTDPNTLQSTSRTVNLEGIAYLHDFVVTDKHIIFLHHPLIFDATKAATPSSMFKNGIVNLLAQPQDYATTIYLLERSSDIIKSITLDDTFFVSHHIHAHYDKNSILHLTSVCYPSYLKLPGNVATFEIDVNLGKLLSRKTNSTWIELPAEASHGCTYSTCTLDGSHPMQSLCYMKKADMHIYFGRLQHHHTNCMWGEPAVVGEHVMAFSQDILTGHTTLDIFDMFLKNHVCQLGFQDMRFPIGLHGTFVKDELL